MPKHNNVTRLLAAHSISFVAHDLPLEKLGAVEAAAFMGVSPERVYKTIVVLPSDPGKPLLVLVPGACVVDLKALAVFTRQKKVRLPTEREAEELTGLQAGGISPLALLHRGFDVILDSSASSQATIFVSGGQRGLNIELRPADLVRITRARLAAVSKPEDAFG